MPHFHGLPFWSARKSRLFVLALASVLFSPTFVHAQKKGGTAGEASTPATRSIEGRVLSASGAAVPGAVVLIKDSKTLQVRSYIAQADGRYHFFGLSTDVNYSLRAEAQEMISKTKNVSVFDGHRQVKLDLKLDKKRAKK